MFTVDDNVVRVEFPFHTVHPVLNRKKTVNSAILGSKFLVKIPGVYCQIFMGIISVQMVCDLKT